MTAIPPRLLNQTVQIQSVAGMDDYGDVTYGPKVTYPARVDLTRRLTRNAAGEEVVTYSTVYLPGHADVADDSRIWLPNGVSRPIISVSAHYGRSNDTPVYVEVTTS